MASKSFSAARSRTDGGSPTFHGARWTQKPIVDGLQAVYTGSIPVGASTGFARIKQSHRPRDESCTDHSSLQSPRSSQSVSAFLRKPTEKVCLEIGPSSRFS